MNTDGLQRGGKIVVVNGNIEILAAGDATIGGTLIANGAPGRAAGNVTITTGGNTHITSRAPDIREGQGQVLQWRPCQSAGAAGSERRFRRRGGAYDGFIAQQKRRRSWWMTIWP